MLEVRGAIVRFAGRDALAGVDLDVGPAETVAVLGPSGSGKTTLLRAIAGLQHLDAGSVCWNGEDLGPTPPHERRFGLMFQEYALFPHRNVFGNVEFGLRMARMPRDARGRSVNEVLDLVGLRELRERRVASLSGGEQQRVALARALVVEPRLLMLDEPLGALDREWRERLLRELRALLDRTALPALYVTHDQSEAFAIASRVAVMRAGRVVQTGTPAAVWSHPADAWIASFLGFGPAVRGTVDGAGLHTPWGVLPTSFSGCGTVIAVVRPDAVRLDAAGPLTARVERTRFTGVRVDVMLQPASGPPVSCTVDARDAPVEGASVRCSLDPDAVLVYPDTAD